MATDAADGHAAHGRQARGHAPPRADAILQGELASVGAGTPGRNAERMLRLDEPAIAWVAMAAAMGIEGARCDSLERFTSVLGAAMAWRGPFLIEAVP